MTVGNAMMADDGAGPLLGELLRTSPQPGWEVIDGGTMPEDMLHRIRTLKPEAVLVVDAADFGGMPGEVSVIEPEAIEQMFVMSTHSLPLNFLIEELQSFVPEVHFVGIQPAIVAFSFPITEMVESGVGKIHQALGRGDIGEVLDALQEKEVSS
nr:hydrogenase maturation peptidase HycI [Ferrimonas balearica]